MNLVNANSEEAKSFIIASNEENKNYYAIIYRGCGLTKHIECAERFTLLNSASTRIGILRKDNPKFNNYKIFGCDAPPNRKCADKNDLFEILPAQKKVTDTKSVKPDTVAPAPAPAPTATPASVPASTPETTYRCKLRNKDALDASCWCISNGLQYVQNANGVHIVKYEQRSTFHKLLKAENVLRNLKASKKNRYKYANYKVYSCDDPFAPAPQTSHVIPAPEVPKFTGNRILQECTSALKAIKTAEIKSEPEVTKPAKEDIIAKTEPEKKVPVKEEPSEAPAEIKENKPLNPKDTILKNWISAFEGINTFINVIPAYYGSLTKDLAKKDRELQDIQHYLELNAFDEAEAFKLSKLQQLKLQERRRIKDKLSIIQSFCDSDMSNLSTEKILSFPVSRVVKTLSVIKSLDTREYSSREMDVHKFLEEN